MLLWAHKGRLREAYSVAILDDVNYKPASVYYAFFNDSSGNAWITGVYLRAAVYFLANPQHSYTTLVKSFDNSMLARFVVGIDLGTTNCAVCFVDTQGDNLTPRTFSISQFVARDSSEARETLPSFYYQPSEAELTARFPVESQKSKSKKHAPYLVGVFARDHGAKVPGRLISSAKSWLSHSGVDRTAPLLPWQASAEVEKLSPVEVSSRYLDHIRQTWDEANPNYPLAQQDVVITLPASFDEVARELTISAAKLAGLNKIVLLEEPQAAFYAFLSGIENESSEEFFRSNTTSVVPKILVCDIGGGTTDLTLIKVRKTDDGKLRFHRVAVGEHLILGGDNFDLTLAHHVQTRLAAEKKLPINAETENGTRLPLGTWAMLVRQCCEVKELMLGKNTPEKTTLMLPGLGSKLIGGSMQIELTRDEIRGVLIEGFFPHVPLDSKPTRHQSGFREFGLPFASDAAITKHLAQFLTIHRNSGDEPDDIVPEGVDPARPDFVLFNGGVFSAETLKDRLVDVLAKWFAVAPNDTWKPVVLANSRLDLSVARGAAYYGMVRRGVGERISASLARTYYVGVGEGESIRAVCLLPASTEPDLPVVLEEPLFELLIGKPVSFPLFVSSLRLTDKPGEMFETDPEQLRPLPPIKTVLKTRRKNPGMICVRLGGKLTEIGTLEIFAEEIQTTAKKGLVWKLEFDVRSTTQTEIDAYESDREQDGVFDESAWEDMESCLLRAFSGDSSDPIKPSEVVRKLAEAAPIERNDWPTSLLRRIGEALMKMESGRKLSAEHESRWLNLIGYAYRPGFGFAMDDWRIDQLWKTVQSSLVHKTPAVRVQWWILLRRIAGGLTSGQQRSICDPIMVNVRALHKQLVENRGRGSDLDMASQEGTEIWRTLGSMELLPLEMKTELGNMILDLIGKKKLEPVYDPMVWALGRLGARILLSGPLNSVISTQTASKWITRLLKDGKGRQIDYFTFTELARKTDDKYRDISDELRTHLVANMEKTSVPENYLKWITESSSLDSTERNLIFGESLPVGLRISE